MSEELPPNDPAGMDQLMEEASLWFARMRGPDAENFRADFEAWLALGASHLGAYNRAGEIFALGRFLAHENVKAAHSRSQARLRSSRPIWAIAASVVLAVGLGIWMVIPQIGGLPSSGSVKIARTDPAMGRERTSYSTMGAAKRVVRLSDGSVVTLDANTILTTDFGAGSRELRLGRGSARFDVAHEGRNFIVRAGGGSITAKGTIFDVILTPENRVTVRLLRGAVDVARPDRPGGIRAGQSPSVTRLAVGDELSFGSSGEEFADVAPPIIGASASDEIATLSSIREFDQAPLSYVIAQANKGSVTQIRLVEPTIGALKVSGRFRVDDAEQVADRLALLFDLKVEHGGRDEIMLRTR